MSPRFMLSRAATRSDRARHELAYIAGLRAGAPPQPGGLMKLQPNSPPVTPPTPAPAATPVPAATH